VDAQDGSVKKDAYGHIRLRTIYRHHTTMLVLSNGRAPIDKLRAGLDSLVFASIPAGPQAVRMKHYLDLILNRQSGV
jgi:hypothetical protein